MTVKILGTGCKKCKTLESKVRELVDQNNLNVNVEKVTDIKDMLKYGIMSTPALVIDEKVKSAGVIPNDNQIIEWIKGERI
ncbi:MAG: thioredoxin family protein [Bacteroidetes bacterium]|nr:thioredoxin family protein [Bacteroidota bacterium]